MAVPGKMLHHQGQMFYVGNGQNPCAPQASTHWHGWRTDSQRPAVWPPPPLRQAAGIPHSTWSSRPCTYLTDL